MKKTNTLMSIRDTYAGPWPRAIFAFLFVVIVGHFIGVFVLGAESSWSLLAGNLFVGIFLVFTSFKVKKKYSKS